MSATAIALKILEDRGDLQQTYGQRAFAILLFQDMSVVPLLALLPLLAPGGDSHASFADAVLSVAKIAAAIAAVVVAGRYLLNPFLRLLAGTGAREVMTAAALLVVLGAAALMQAVGMSMALGAFLAGVLLAESNYRHELEADIEPFRGLLLALFFMGVGMTIDVPVVCANLWLDRRGRAGRSRCSRSASSGCCFCRSAPRTRRAARRLGAHRAPASSPSCCFRSASSLGALTAPRREACSPRSRPSPC